MLFKLNLCKVLTSTHTHTHTHKINKLKIKKKTAQKPYSGANIKFTCKLYLVVIWYNFIFFKLEVSLWWISNEWIAPAFIVCHHNLIYARMTIQSFSLSSCRRCLQVGWHLCVNTDHKTFIIYCLSLCIVSHYCQHSKENKYKEVGDHK